MKIDKAAAIPLVCCDPFFSIWSAHDNLNGGGTTHWCGAPHSLNGYVTVGDSVYCFLGKSGVVPIIEQKELHVTATKTTAVYENNKLIVTADFITPLLLNEPELAARPVSYINVNVVNKTADTVAVCIVAQSDIVRKDDDMLCGFNGNLGELSYAQMGKLNQKPLGESGDNVTINWGYLYLATAEGEVRYNEKEETLVATATPNQQGNACILIAYDDIASINYFGDFKRGLWARRDKTITNAIADAHKNSSDILARCDELDKKIESTAKNIAGDDYAFLCNMSYRHTISAHKLIEDNEGNIIVLSKENDSNGCIGTADVSYPSIPLFMLFGTEYVKGMIRPIMSFAECDVWEYDFAPHDIGRYPYAWGQVYGLNHKFAGVKSANGRRFDETAIYPPFYNFPKGSDVYSHEYQMPVEECGNLLIMIANVCITEKSADFALPYMQTLDAWVEYLVKYGSDPQNQLCTDDFAGHLAHNVNLAFKAVMGIEGYAQILRLADEGARYERYHKLAQDMANDCHDRAKTSSGTRLTFDNEQSWSLKYNTVWDKIWQTGLFAEEFFVKEVDCYIKNANSFGTPLDSRRDYTKSDWILWCAAMAKDRQRREKLISPVANFLANTESRVPFSDWYDTKTGRYEHFIARSVQGGIFMPFVYDNFNDLLNVVNNE